MRFEMVQCDARLDGCEGERLFDSAGDWLIDTEWMAKDALIWDLCPNCADKLALEAELELEGRS